MKCVGVIVTYNRKKLLLKNLEILSKQTVALDKVLIIDNHSTDGTMEAVKGVYSNADWIDYRYMDGNYGGAGGFYYGIKYARALDYDLIWLMDDDGRPFNEYTYEKIIRHIPEFYKKNKMLFLNSLVTVDGERMSFGLWPTKDLQTQIKLVGKEQKEGVLYGKANPFNGTMITKELVDTVGYPRKEFFLSRDETDYMKRSMDAGALVATIVDSIYYHPASKLEYKKIGNISTQIYNDLDKEYYFLRNLTFTYKEKHKLKIFGFSFLRIITIVLYENNKIKRLKQVFTAVNDGFKSKMGKRQQK